MLPHRVTVVEVGPRDGFQMESGFIPTDTKVAIINQLARSGLSKIEVTSFSRPDVIPQLRDAAVVLEKIDRVPGVSFIALVPNLKGVQQAIESRADGVKLVLAATETSNRRNVNMSVAESLKCSEAMLKLADDAHLNAEAVVAVAFGCPYEGDVADSTVVDLITLLSRIGFREISIADTVGVANPEYVRRRCSILLERCPTIHLALHLHNTRGLGLANVLAALQEGLDQFDASTGGIGGCPIVRGGSGNISTEDLVNMLDEMGIESGVSLDGVLQAGSLIQTAIGRQLSSYIFTVGTRMNLYDRARQAGHVQS